MKQAVGKKAASLVQDGMVVGLGTGSTASKFVIELAKRVQEEKLRITCVASSVQTEELAKKMHLPCTPIDRVRTIDITCDGADQVDAQKRLIKGAGGALLREKIIAHASSELVILVDETKCVHSLGHMALPVEIAAFGHLFTCTALQNMGFEVLLRKNKEKPYITDNGNYIVDIQLASICKNPEQMDRAIRSIPGVVETGFFFNLAKKVLIGKKDGSIMVT